MMQCFLSLITITIKCEKSVIGSIVTSSLAVLTADKRLDIVLTFSLRLIAPISSALSQFIPDSTEAVIPFTIDTSSLMSVKGE